jgi:phage terminase large subunit
LLRATPAQARTVINRCEKDTVFFSRSVLGVEPVSISQRIMRALEKYDEVSVATAHGLTKSWTAAVLTLHFGSVGGDRKVITTATKLLQVKGAVWDEVGRLAERSRIPLGCDVNVTDIKWRNGSRAFGMTAAPNTEAGFQGFRGANGTLIIVDEAPGVARPIMDGVYSMLTGGNTKLLMIGNPTDPNGVFADSFKRKSVCKIQLSAFDSPNVAMFGVTVQDIVSGEYLKKVPPKDKSPFIFLPTAHWIRQQWEIWTNHGARMNDPRWMARVLGRFPTETEDTLIPMSWIDAAFSLWNDDEAAAAKHVRAAVDVSDEGPDGTAIAVGRGSYAWIEAFQRGADPTMAANMADPIFKTMGVQNGNIDGVGVGAGTFTRLRELKHKVSKFVSGAGPVGTPAETEPFKNLRAQGWWMLRDRFYESYRMVVEGRGPEKPFIALRRDQYADSLAEELNSVRWSASGKEIILEEKKITKQRLGRSPDLADAMMMLYAPTSKRVVIV